MLRECHGKSPAYSTKCSTLLSTEVHGTRSSNSSVSLPSISSTYHIETCEAAAAAAAAEGQLRAASAEASRSLSTNSSGVGDFHTPNQNPLNHYLPRHPLAELPGAGVAALPLSAPSERVASVGAAAPNLSATFDVSLRSPLRLGSNTDFGSGGGASVLTATTTTTTTAAALAGVVRPRFAQTPPPSSRSALPSPAGGSQISATSSAVASGRSPLRRGGGGGGGGLVAAPPPPPPPPPPPRPSSSTSPETAAAAATLVEEEEIVGSEAEVMRWTRPTPPLRGCDLYRPIPDALAPVLAVTFDEEEDEDGEEEEEGAPRSILSATSDPSITNSVAVFYPVTTASAPASFCRSRAPGSRSTSREKRRQQTPPSSSIELLVSPKAAAVSATSTCAHLRGDRAVRAGIVKGPHALALMSSSYPSIGASSNSKDNNDTSYNASDASSSFSGTAAAALPLPSQASVVHVAETYPAPPARCAGPSHFPLAPSPPQTPPSTATASADTVPSLSTGRAPATPTAAAAMNVHPQRERRAAWGAEEEEAGKEKEKPKSAWTGAHTTVLAATPSPPRLPSPLQGVWGAGGGVKHLRPPRTVQPESGPPHRVGSPSAVRTATRGAGVGNAYAARSATTGFAVVDVTKAATAARRTGQHRTFADRCATSLPASASPGTDELDVCGMMCEERGESFSEGDGVPAAEVVFPSISSSSISSESSSGSSSESESGSGAESEEEDATGVDGASSDAATGMDRLFHRVMKAQEVARRRQAECASTPASAAGVLAPASPRPLATSLSAVPRAPAVNVFTTRTSRPPCGLISPTGRPQRPTSSTPRTPSPTPKPISFGAASANALATPPSTPPLLHAVHAPVVRGRIDVPTLPRGPATLAERVLSPLSGACRALPSISLGSSTNSSSGSSSGSVEGSRNVTMSSNNCGGETMGVSTLRPPGGDTRGMLSTTVVAFPPPLSAFVMKGSVALTITPSTTTTTTTTATNKRSINSISGSSELAVVRSVDGHPWEPAAVEVPSTAASLASLSPETSPSSASSFSSASSSSSLSSPCESSTQSETFCQLRTRSHAQAEHHKDKATGQLWVSTRIEVEELPSGVRRVAPMLDGVTSTITEARGVAAPVSASPSTPTQRSVPSSPRMISPANVRGPSTSLGPVVSTAISAGSSSGGGGGGARPSRSPLEMDEDEEDSGAASSPSVQPAPAYLLPGLAATYHAATGSRRQAGPLTAQATAAVVAAPLHVPSRPLPDDGPLQWDNDEKDEEEEEEEDEDAGWSRVRANATPKRVPQSRSALANTDVNGPLCGFGPLHLGSTVMSSAAAAAAATTIPAAIPMQSLMDSFNVRVVDVSALASSTRQHTTTTTPARANASPLTATTPAVLSRRTSPAVPDARSPLFPSTALAALEGVPVVVTSPSTATAPSFASMSSLSLSSSSSSSACPLSPCMPADDASPLALSSDLCCRDLPPVLGRGGGGNGGAGGHGRLAFLSSALAVSSQGLSGTGSPTCPLVAVRAPSALLDCNGGPHHVVKLTASLLGGSGSVTAVTAGCGGGGGRGGCDPLAEDDAACSLGWTDSHVIAPPRCRSADLDMTNAHDDATPSPTAALDERRGGGAGAVLRSSRAGLAEGLTGSFRLTPLDYVPPTATSALSLNFGGRLAEADEGSSTSSTSSGSFGSGGKPLTSDTSLGEPRVVNAASFSTAPQLNGKTVHLLDTTGGEGPLSINGSFSRPFLDLPPLPLLSPNGATMPREVKGCGPPLGNVDHTQVSRDMQGGAEALLKSPTAPVVLCMPGAGGSATLEGGTGVGAQCGAVTSLADLLVALPPPLPAFTATTTDVASVGAVTRAPLKAIRSRGGPGVGPVGRSRARFACATHSPVITHAPDFPPPPPPLPMCSATALLAVDDRGSAGRVGVEVRPGQCAEGERDADGNPFS